MWSVCKNLSLKKNISKSHPYPLHHSFPSPSSVILIMHRLRRGSASSGSEEVHRWPRRRWLPQRRRRWHLGPPACCDDNNDTAWIRHLLTPRGADPPLADLEHADTLPGGLGSSSGHLMHESFFSIFSFQKFWYVTWRLRARNLFLQHYEMWIPVAFLGKLPFPIIQPGARDSIQLYNAKFISHIDMLCFQTFNLYHITPECSLGGFLSNRLLCVVDFRIII